MRSAFILALVALTAFAGCLDGDTETEAAPETTEEVARMDLGTLTVSESGTILLSSEDPVNAQCGLAGEGIDMATHTFEVPADVDGTAAKAKDFTLTLTMDTTGLDLDLFLLDAAGNELSSSTEFNAQGAPTETVTAKTLAPGTYTIEVRSCTGVNAGYALEGSATLVSA